MSSSLSSSLANKKVVPVEDAVGVHGESNVKFVDGSWFLGGRNARQEFEAGPRIVGSTFFDIDDIATPSSLPHMMPPKKLFEAAMDAMGIGNQDHIIVYGTKDCMFVPRAWFQIRNMGHDKSKIHLLDGSLDDWIAKGGPIEQAGTQPSNPTIYAKDLNLDEPTSYQSTGPQNIVDMAEMIRLIKQKDDADAIIVDVRAQDRFLGKVDEPRPNLRLGHMPGAKNVLFKDLLKNENLTQFKPKEELEQIISNAGVDLTSDKRIIATCGSGATACVLVMALELCGKNADDCFVYDGSWCEWGSNPDTPIVK